MLNRAIVSHMWRTGLPLLVSVIAVTLSAPVRAGPALDEARQAYAGLEYERCRAQAKGALEEPATREERVEAYRLMGLCRAALGDTEPAREAFIHMLAIDPEARLPEGLSPRFTSSYLEAKGYWVGQKTLTLQVARSRTEGGKRVVLLEIHDPMEQVAKVSFRKEFGELSPGLKAAPRMELELPGGEPVEIVALDAHGGEVALLSVGAPEVPKIAADSDVKNTPTETVEEPPAGSDVWMWVAVGAGTGVLVAGAAAAGLGVYLYQPRAVNLRSDVAFGDE